MLDLARERANFIHVPSDSTGSKSREVGGLRALQRLGGLAEHGGPHLSTDGLAKQFLCDSLSARTVLASVVFTAGSEDES